MSIRKVRNEPASELTKREYLVMKIATAMLQKDRNYSPHRLADDSVEFADEILRRLE